MTDTISMTDLPLNLQKNMKILVGTSGKTSKTLVNDFNQILNRDNVKNLEVPFKFEKAFSILYITYCPVEEPIEKKKIEAEKRQPCIEEQQLKKKLQEDKEQVKKIEMDKKESIRNKIRPSVLIPSKINASVINNIIDLKGRINGEKVNKAVPRCYTGNCTGCEQGCSFDLVVTDYEKFLNYKGAQFKYLNTQLTDYCSRRSEASEKRPVPFWNVNITEYWDYSEIWLQDRLEDMLEMKNTNTEFKVVLIGPEVTKGRLVSVEGEIFCDPKTREIYMISHKIEGLKTSAQNLQLTDKEKEDFKICFGNSIDIKHQIAPDMVGMDDVRESRILTLHSPIWIPDIYGDRIIRGSLRELLIGDTKTNKTESVKDTTEDMRVGEIVSAETGSRAGLLYAVDTDKNIIRWGALPLADGGYIAIDGLNALPSMQMPAFREALTQQRVKVSMAVHGVAPVRVRLTGIMNPTLPMMEYPMYCQSIPASWVFKKLPDITRWDIFIPFDCENVDIDEIVDREKTKRPMSNDLFVKHVHWAWGLKAKNISYTDEAKQEIKKHTKEIIKLYRCTDLPIVGLHSRDVIVRLSVATAVKNHSTTDCINVVVTKEDVVEAVEFYRRMLDNLGLLDYVDTLRKSIEVTDEIIKDFLSTSDLMQGHLDILLYGLKKGRYTSSKIIGNVINCSESTVRKHYVLLKEYELIETKAKAGMKLSRKGIVFCKKLFGVGTKSGEKFKDIIIELHSLRNKKALDIKPAIEKEQKTMEKNDGDWCV